MEWRRTDGFSKERKGNGRIGDRDDQARKTGPGKNVASRLDSNHSNLREISPRSDIHARTHARTTDNDDKDEDEEDGRGARLEDRKTLRKNVAGPSRASPDDFHASILTCELAQTNRQPRARHRIS